MIEDSCPIPSKKLRTQGSSEHSDSEELKLSKSFDEDYRILMNEEILKICTQPVHFDDDFEIGEVIANFHSECGDLLKWIEKTLDKPRQKNQCRSDINLVKFEKALNIQRLFESPRFTNINVLAKLIVSNQPQLESDIQNKLDELRSMWNLKSLNLDIDLSNIVKDIKADIDDLKSWQGKIDKILGQQIDDHRMEYVESIETILNDFKVHDDIINSITKMIEKITQLDSIMIHSEALLECKMKLEDLISLIHSQWLKAMELKLKLESMSGTISEYNLKRNLGINILGQESGFESEISPLNPTRGLPMRNLCVMKYISSSGECMFDDNTTDFPMDSESSSTLSVDLANYNNNNSSSSSSSLIGNMLDLQRNSQKDESYVRKKQKRLKKRRHQFSKATEFPTENLSTQEREKYLQIRNAFFKQSHSLKRRISETSIIQALDRSEEEASCRILDLAAAAEKFVMKNDLNHRAHSLSESPKESELDDEYNIVISSANELNVKEVWDNYQASLYSNDDGDSQIVEVDNIKDWEQDLETDDQDREGMQLQILTSGYETSMECDTHMCNKNLINVIQFSTNQQLDVNERFNIIIKQLDTSSSSIANRINCRINEQLSIANTHAKLLDQIINNDPCVGSKNEAIMEQVLSLQREWENLIRKFIIIQSRCERIMAINPLDKLIEDINRINGEISTLYKFNDVCDLHSTIDFLKEKKSELSNIDIKIACMQSDTKFLNSEQFNSISEDKIKSRQKDLTILTCCMKRLIDCQKKRKYVEGQLKCFTVLEKTDNWKAISQDMLRVLDDTRMTLDTCVCDLSDVSSELCSDKLKCCFDEEMSLLDKLNIKLTLAMPMIDGLRSKVNKTIFKTAFTGFLGRLPVQVAIFVIVAMFGLWFKNQSSYPCQGSSDWFKMLRKYTNNLEPH